MVQMVALSFLKLFPESLAFLYTNFIRKTREGEDERAAFMPGTFFFK